MPSPALNPYETNPVDMYHQTRQSYQPLQHHLYSSLPPNKKTLAPHERSAHDFFLNEKLRTTLQKKQSAAIQTLSNSNLPSLLHSYHSLVPLDVQPIRSDRVFGYPSSVYKAFSKADGGTYALRRLEGFKLVNEANIGLVERWRKVSCANVVTVKEAFTSKAFNDDSIVFVHEYHPLSTTLYDLYNGQQTRKFSPKAVLGEKLIWSYATQLINAVRATHAAGLACRVIDSTKILVTEKNRLRLNCCGVSDVVSPSAREDLAMLQRADLKAVGEVIVGLVSSDEQSPTESASLAGFTKRGYSTALFELIDSLLTSTDSAADLLAGCISALADKTMQNFDESLSYNDSLESELAKETENGRLVRMLCKMGFINERPEFEHDVAWSETGERYIIKLFRDHVFHQVNENGYPVLDLAHVITCLNKLDAGSDERIMLVSRDEQSCLVTSYKELKMCMEAAFLVLRNTGKTR